MKKRLKIILIKIFVEFHRNPRILIEIPVTLEEFNSHLNSWIIIRLSNRILIEINEIFYDNSMAIYFLKNSDLIQDKFHKNSVVI